MVSQIRPNPGKLESVRLQMQNTHSEKCPNPQPSLVGPVKSGFSSGLL